MITRHYYPTVFSRTDRVSDEVDGAGRTVADLLPESLGGEFVCVRNDSEIVRPPAAGAVVVSDGDDLHYMPVPGGFFLGVVLPSIIVKAAIIAAKIAVLAGIGFAIQSLLGPPDPEESDSPQTGVLAPIGNSNRRGAEIPVPYGQPRIGGQRLSQYVTLDNFGNAFVHVLLALGEGRIEGIGSQTAAFDNLASDDSDLADVQLNGNSFEQYSGATASFRPGELDQVPIDGFNKLHNLIPKDVNIEQALDAFGDGAAGAGDWVSHSTAQPIDFARLIFTFKNGLYHAKDKGGTKAFHCFIDIRYRTSDDGGGAGAWQYVDYDADARTWTTTTVEANARPVVFEGHRVTAFSAEFELPFTTRDDYDIECRWQNLGLSSTNPRVWVPATDSRFAPPQAINRITWSFVDEVTEEALAYPGTALLAVHDIDVRQTSGSIPVITALVKGVRVPVWDGVDPDNPVYARQWSNNPAWIALDVLTSERYSIGEVLGASDPDLDDLLELASFCDQMVDDGAGGTEKLATFDAVLGADSAWNTLLTVLRVARTVPIQTGTDIRFKTEKARSRAHMFGMGNIVEGAWKMQYLNTDRAPNQISVQYRNADRDFEPDLAVFELPEVVDEGKPLVKQFVQMIGITRPGHAHREAKFLGLLGKNVDAAAEFAAGLDAIGVEAGDRFGMTHDIPQWSFSGRLGAGSTTTTVVLDRDVTLAAGTTYDVTVHHPSDDSETREITSPAGDYVAGDALSVDSAFSWAPTERYVYSLGAQGSVDLDWIANQLSTDFSLRTQFQCVKYDPDVYTDSLVLGPILESDTSAKDPNGHRIPSDVENLALDVVPQTFRDGSSKPAIRVSWRNPDEVGNRRREVFYKNTTDDVWRSAGETLEVEHLVLDDLEPGVTYEVSVVGVADFGDRGHPDCCPSVSVAYDPAPPRPVPPTGLAVNRVGDVVTLSWDEPPVDAQGLPSNRNLAHYEVRRGTEWREAYKVADVRGRSVALTEWAPLGEHLLVKPVDTDGQESRLAAGLWTDLEPPVGFSTSLERDERALGWPGTKATVSVDTDGTLTLDAAQVGGIYTTPEIDLGAVKDWYVTLVGTPVQRWLDLDSTAARIAVTNVTDGPFSAGETVTGGTSGATAKVLEAAAEGVAHLYVKPVSGTFSAGETLTGGTSGATTTARTAAIALTFGDAVWSRWGVGGPGEEDHTNSTNVELLAGVTSARDLQSGFRQGVLRCRYLQVVVTLSTDDVNAYRPYMENLRLVVTEKAPRLENLLTGETDTTKTLKPDGAGGAVWS